MPSAFHCRSSAKNLGRDFIRFADHGQLLFDIILMLLRAGRFAKIAVNRIEALDFAFQCALVDFQILLKFGRDFAPLNRAAQDLARQNGV